MLVCILRPSLDLIHTFTYLLITYYSTSFQVIPSQEVRYSGVARTTKASSKYDVQDVQASDLYTRRRRW